MSHEIEQVRMLDGRLAIEAMFADGTPGWHRLGHTYAPGFVPTREDLQRDCPSMFFTVEKEAIRLVNDRDGQAPAIEDQYALVRQDTAKTLHIVGKDYKIWQNNEAFDFMDSLQMDGIMKYETAIVLKGGKQMVILARLPGVDTITKGDHSFRYILCTFSHGGGAIVLMPTSIRVVCWNTLQMALGAGQFKVSIRHSGDLKTKLDIAHKAISQFDAAFTNYREGAQRLLTGWTNEKLREYIEELFPANTTATTDKGKSGAETRRQKRIDQVRTAFKSPANNMPGVKGTWWQAFNAVTETVDHGKRTERSRDARENLENRFVAITEGEASKFKSEAFELALEMAC